MTEEIKTYSVDELEEMYGISRKTLLRYIKDKKLNGIKIPGKAWRIREDEFKKFMEERNAKLKHK